MFGLLAIVDFLHEKIVQQHLISFCDQDSIFNWIELLFKYNYLKSLFKIMIIWYDIFCFHHSFFPGLH